MRRHRKRPCYLLVVQPSSLPDDFWPLETCPSHALHSALVHSFVLLSPARSLSVFAPADVIPQSQPSLSVTLLIASDILGLPLRSLGPLTRPDPVPANPTARVQQQQARPQPASESTSIEIGPLINNPQRLPSRHLSHSSRLQGLSAAPFFSTAALVSRPPAFIPTGIPVFVLVHSGPSTTRRPGPLTIFLAIAHERFCLPSFE